MDYPRLRPVETFPIEHNGEKFVGLRDPLSLTEKVVFLPSPTVFIVSLFDGKHSLRDVQAAFMRQFGQLVYMEQLLELVDQLDEQLFLESEHFRQFELRLQTEFSEAPTRKPAHAGQSYPEDPQKLRDFLAAHLAEASQEGSQTAAATGRVPRGIITPHIDLREGGNCYGWAYEQIRPHDYDLFVILGTAHAPVRNIFTATRKDYETPLGVVRTDRSTVDRLINGYGSSLIEDEFVHKLEHSIEFQVVWLQYLFGSRTEFEVLPILCGSFHEMLSGRSDPSTEEKFSRFIDVVSRILDTRIRRICWIAAADLAHIGLRFGDSSGPDGPELQRLEQEDRTMLQAVAGLDKRGFWRLIQEESDRRRICGFPCITTLLHLIQAESGVLLKYNQMDDRRTGSAVSYASLIFF